MEWSAATGVQKNPPGVSVRALFGVPPPTCGEGDVSEGDDLRPSWRVACTLQGHPCVPGSHRPPPNGSKSVDCLAGSSEGAKARTSVSPPQAGLENIELQFSVACGNSKSLSGSVIRMKCVLCSRLRGLQAHMLAPLYHDVQLCFAHPVPALSSLSSRKPTYMLSNSVSEVPSEQIHTLEFATLWR